jgi:hypothetical protein
VCLSLGLKKPGGLHNVRRSRVPTSINSLRPSLSLTELESVIDRRQARPNTLGLRPAGRRAGPGLSLIKGPELLLHRLRLWRATSCCTVGPTTSVTGAVVQADRARDDGSSARDERLWRAWRSSLCNPPKLTTSSHSPGHFSRQKQQLHHRCPKVTSTTSNS